MKRARRNTLPMWRPAAPPRCECADHVSLTELMALCGHVRGCPLSELK